MSEQPVDDPVRDAGHRLVQSVQLAALAAEALTQTQRGHAQQREAADQRDTVTLQVAQRVIQAEDQVWWSPLLPRSLRPHLTPADLARSRAATETWRPEVWEAERAARHADRLQRAAATEQRDATPTVLPARRAPSVPLHVAAAPLGAPVLAGQPAPQPVLAPSISPAASTASTSGRAGGGASPAADAPALAAPGFPEPFTADLLIAPAASTPQAPTTAPRAVLTVAPGPQLPTGRAR